MTRYDRGDLVRTSISERWLALANLELASGISERWLALANIELASGLGVHVYNFKSFYAI